MILNCIVVDDNSTQRLDTLRLVNNHTSLSLVGKFTTKNEAKKFLLTNSVDLIILEINLSISDGFELLDVYHNNFDLTTPSFIITSEDTSHAFKAFEYNVVDYLEKPVFKKRFDEAIAKTVLKAKMKENLHDSDGEHIFVKSNLKKRKIYINQIKWIEALGDYVKLITNNKSFVILSTMKAFENELPKGMFLRIHKSYIVNLKKVERYDNKHVEIEKMKLPLSRTRKAQLSQALDLIVS
jgi:two-component system, LytTR family, response regulator